MRYWSWRFDEDGGEESASLTVEGRTPIVPCTTSSWSFSRSQRDRSGVDEDWVPRMPGRMSYLVDSDENVRPESLGVLED